MAIRWEDEPWVKLYTRDHADWLEISGPARSVFYTLLRKVEPAGIIHLGKSGIRGIAKLIEWPWELLEPYLQELIADGCLQVSADRLTIKNFIEAQSARTSDVQRKRIQREKARAAQGDTASGPAAQPDPPRDSASQDVTAGHSAGDLVPARPPASQIGTIRSEEIRGEERSPTPPVDPPARAETPPPRPAPQPQTAQGPDAKRQRPPAREVKPIYGIQALMASRILRDERDQKHQTPTGLHPNAQNLLTQQWQRATPPISQDDILRLTWLCRLKRYGPKREALGIGPWKGPRPVAWLAERDGLVRLLAQAREHTEPVEYEYRPARGEVSPVMPLETEMEN